MRSRGLGMLPIGSVGIAIWWSVAIHIVSRSVLRQRRDPHRNADLRRNHSAAAWQPVVKLQLHSAGAASRLAALLLVQILPVLHPTVHKTHGGDPALRSSRRSAGVPTARTVRRGVERPGASPPSVRRWTFTTGCYDGSSAAVHGRKTMTRWIPAAGVAIMLAVAQSASAQGLDELRKLYDAGQYEQVVAASPGGEPRLMFLLAQSQQKL